MLHIICFNISGFHANFKDAEEEGVWEDNQKDHYGIFKKATKQRLGQICIIKTDPKSCPSLLSEESHWRVSSGDTEWLDWHLWECSKCCAAGQFQGDMQSELW